MQRLPFHSCHLVGCNDYAKAMILCLQVQYDLTLTPDHKVHKFLGCIDNCALTAMPKSLQACSHHTNSVTAHPYCVLPLHNCLQT